VKHAARHNEDMLLIGGGVGPMAGLVLHRKIIEFTQTDGTDQDHLEVIHLSRSPLIGDRSEFLAGLPVPDPVEGMLRVFRMAAAGLVREGRTAAAGIPCNTFHATKIFAPFCQALAEERLPIRLIHMLEETAETLRIEAPGARRIGVLSTTGTRRTGVYEHILQKHGLEVCYIPEESQDELHEAIYHRRWGLKAVSPARETAVKRVRRFSQLLIDSGAEAVILGCTELPLALPEGNYEGIPHLDPMSTLARALIREAAPDRLLRQ
jgi:aspartate racemase